MHLHNEFENNQNIQCGVYAKALYFSIWITPYSKSIDT